MSTQLVVERPSSLFPRHSPYSLNEHPLSLPPSTHNFRYDPINSEQNQSFFPGHHQPYPVPYPSSSRMRTATDSNSTKQSSTGGTMGMINTNLSGDDNGSGVIKRTNKTHVPSACVNCKKAHLACDEVRFAGCDWDMDEPSSNSHFPRPCKRCVALGKVETCVDIKHKKRGRPKLKDKKQYPYDTHATADAKTWGTNPQFLPPTTADPDQQSGSRHHVDQPPPPQNQQHSFSSFIPSPPHLHSPPVSNRPMSFHRPSQYLEKPSKQLMRSPSVSSLPESPSSTITMYLTIDGATCASVSKECLGIMGYYPLELVNKSIYDYILPGDVAKFQKFFNSLLESVHRCNNTSNQHSYQSTSDPRFSQCSSHDGIEVSGTINLRQRIGQYDLYNVRMYLERGSGFDFARRETYVVALFTKIKSDTYTQSGDCSPYVRPLSADPALHAMNIGVGRSGLLSPVLSPRQSHFSDIPPPTSLYAEAPPPPPPSNPHNPNDHFNQSHHHLSDSYQKHRNVTNHFSPIIPRPSPIVPSVHRPEPLVNPGPLSRRSETSPSLLIEGRPSAFNLTRSPPSGIISPISTPAAYKQEFEDSKPNMNASYVHYDRPVSYPHHVHQSRHHDEIPNLADGRDEGMMIPREPGSRGENLRVSDSESTKRMSVTSLLC
ncbi:7066_t:CDS:2 [Acaulospora morrowiae]|uniref:7066_t:CDS:1 n=1 Tax=Acaulospora morrowiae TaxID=94023 RepID=A0A9N8YT53_9GLOM|nr:7066_t:CDS:2 [Acaulospora morrowiae]